MLPLKDIFEKFLNIWLENVGFRSSLACSEKIIPILGSKMKSCYYVSVCSTKFPEKTGGRQKKIGKPKKSRSKTKGGEFISLVTDLQYKRKNRPKFLILKTFSGNCLVIKFNIARATSSNYRAKTMEDIKILLAYVAY